jgi:hypothetical protein
MPIIQLFERQRQGDPKCKAYLDKRGEIPSQKTKQNRKGVEGFEGDSPGGLAQVVEHLPSMLRTLHWVHSPGLQKNFKKLIPNSTFRRQC